MSAKKISKEQLVKKAMAAFDENQGGTNIDPEFTAKDPQALKLGLTKSFDEIFPELISKAKLRKHVIFDEDVLEVYEGLSKGTKTPFSALINSALRKFAHEKLIDDKPIPTTALLAMLDELEGRLDRRSREQGHEHFEEIRKLVGG